MFLYNLFTQYCQLVNCTENTKQAPWEKGNSSDTWISGKQLPDSRQSYEGFILPSNLQVIASHLALFSGCSNLPVGGECNSLSWLGSFNDFAIVHPVGALDGETGLCQVAAQDSGGLVGDLRGIGNDVWDFRWTEMEKRNYLSSLAKMSQHPFISLLAPKYWLEMYHYQCVHHHFLSDFLYCHSTVV